MMKENEALAGVLRELAVKSCISVFSGHGVALHRSSTAWAKRDERLLCGVLGFVGRGVRGTCLLASTEEPVRSSCPQGGRLRDWVGELTNQLGGKLKSQFLARGAEVHLATPIVLTGIQVKPLTATDQQPIVLEQAGDRRGELMVWVEAESDARFQLGPETPVESRDGEVRLF